MLELKTFLKSINAQEAFKNPSTLYLKHEHNVWHSEENLNKLFNLLRDTGIKSLVFIGLFAIKKCSELLAEFLIDPECCITSIKIDSSFVDHEKLAIILEAFKKNNTLQKIDWSNTRVKACEFKAFLVNISQKPNLKVLSLPNVENYSSDTDRLVDSLNKFFCMSNVNSFTLSYCLIQKDIIELFQSIKIINSRVYLRNDAKSNSLQFFEKFFRDSPIHALDMEGFYLDDIGVAAISYFLERNNYTISLSFSLASEISKESIEKLLTPIRNSKVISCSIKKEQGIFERGKEQEQQLSKAIREITAINLNKIKHVSKEIAREIAKEIIPTLRKFYEEKLKLVDCKADDETFKYLKLYRNLHLKEYLKELEVNYDNLDAITKNADKYINECFFEMTGIAKNPATGYFPLEIMRHIASCLKFSDIKSINAKPGNVVLLSGEDGTSEEWVLL